MKQNIYTKNKFWFIGFLYPCKNNIFGSHYTAVVHILQTFSLFTTYYPAYVTLSIIFIGLLPFYSESNLIVPSFLSIFTLLLVLLHFSCFDHSIRPIIAPLSTGEKDDLDSYQTKFLLGKI